MIKPHDNSNFRNIIESGIPYIDKTLFIKSFIKENIQRLILCRPSRTGKSLTLSTFRYFSSIPIDSGFDLNNSWVVNTRI